jgi:diguanylate cyclase (GGDEF)-like protein
MKKWVEKLLQQFDIETAKNVEASEVSEDRATILFMIDNLNKHLLEIAEHPVRKVRETLDDFAKELLDAEDDERVLFRFRQFFATYRIDETAYIQKTFEEFRTIIWDFIDQLAVDIGDEQKEDKDVKQSLETLKEAVESNSIDILKNQSRKFIDSYMETQFRKQKRTQKRIKSIRKNLNSVKKQLDTAKDTLRTDHLTQVHNRRSFDEFCNQNIKLAGVDMRPVSMIMVDADHFKRINDVYGHDVGDFVLKEIANTLKTICNGEEDFVARIGGEEFAIVLPNYASDAAAKMAEVILNKFRAETYIINEHPIRITVSMGIAELCPGEDSSGWLKRTDQALYYSKNNGRNRFTVAAATGLKVVA